MKIKNQNQGLPIIGGSVIEIGKFVYNMIVVLSDHKDPKDQERVCFQHHDYNQAIEVKDKILKEGIHLKAKDKGIEVELFYPPQVVRKIILRKDPLVADPSEVSH